MQTFKNLADTPHSVITADNINIIFYKIPELHRIHFNFIKQLEPKVEHWSPSQQVAEHFKLLVSESMATPLVICIHLRCCFDDCYLIIRYNCCNSSYFASLMVTFVAFL